MCGAGAVQGVGCSLSKCRLHPESGCLNKVCVSLSPTYAGITHLLFCLCDLLLNRKCEKRDEIAISYAFAAAVLTGVSVSKAYQCRPVSRGSRSMRPPLRFAIHVLIDAQQNFPLFLFLLMHFLIFMNVFY